MNKIEAKKLLNSFHNKTALTIEEAIQTYQISLALEDQYQALHYRDTYENIIAQMLLNIGLNLYKPKKIQYNQWQELDLDLRAVLTTIIAKTTRRVKLYNLDYRDELVDFINEEYSLLESRIEEMNLKSKKEKELIELFNKYTKTSQIRKVTREVGIIGHLTDTLDEAEEILELIKLNSNEHLDRPIIENIEMLKNSKKGNVSLQGRTSKVSLRKNDTDTDLLIYSLNTSLKDNLINEDEYDHAVLDIANKIVDELPIVAFNLQNKLHQNWGYILDLQVKVSNVLYTMDLDLGFEYFKKIEVEHYKIETILYFIENNNDINLLKSTVYKMLEHMKINTLKYRVLYELNKKVPVEFEEIYAITSKILPSDDLIFDSDALIEYYKNHYVDRDNICPFIKI